MSLSSRPGSNVDTNEQRKQFTLTPNALTHKIAHFQREIKDKVNEIEGLVKAINDLMHSSDNAKAVQFNCHTVSALYDEASQLHDSVILLLSPEEQERQNIWFSKIHKRKVALIENTNNWLSDINGQTQNTVTSRPTSHQSHPPHVEMSNAVNNGNDFCVAEHPEEEGGVLVDDVSPDDSVSNVTVDETKNRSIAGSKCRSTASSTSSARIIEQADMAALLARQEKLKERHALDEQATQLSRRREQLDLEIEIAASAARLHVLRVSGTSQVSGVASRVDGMQSYLEENRQEVTLNVDAETFVPVSVMGQHVGQISQYTSTGEQQQPRSQFLDAQPEQLHPYSLDAWPGANHVGLQSQPRPQFLDARPDQLHPHSLDARPKVNHVGLQSHSNARPEQLRPHSLNAQSKVNNVEQSQPRPETVRVRQSAGTHIPQSRLQSQLQSYQPAPLAQGSTDHSQLISILERQNQITSLLAEQQSLFFLPRRDIQIFDGDPLEYQTFMRAFEHCIEKKTHSAKDCLYFLEQYTKGQPRDMVRSCQFMSPESGYARAKSLLKECFGNPLKITSAYMDKVFLWPVLKSEDVEALQSYSFLLRACCNALGEFKSTHELDVPSNMQAVVKKLPYKLREKWRDVAFSLQERFHRRATFQDIVQFVESQVKIASDPLFGDLQDSSPAVSRKEVRPAKPQYFAEAKKSSFATTVATVDTESKREYGSSVATACLLCGAEHSLDRCRLFERKTHAEKMSFLREKGACFGCMCIGHRNRECDKRLVCKVCSRRHPTMLHVYSEEEEGSVQAPGEAQAVDENTLITVQSSGLTGAGEGDGRLAILPVRVKSKKGQTLVTYAFLDPGSSASFCTEELMNRLNLSGKRSNILLRTMGQEKVVSSQVVLDLEVAGLDTDSFCVLPAVFTQKSMPVHRGNIPRQEDLWKWPHLGNVNIASIESGVDLLIGTNVPEALEPLEVVRSVDGGPYAVRTMFGWTVSGPLGGSSKTDTACMNSVTVNRISVTKLDQPCEQQRKADAPGCANDERLGLFTEEVSTGSVTKSVQLVGDKKVAEHPTGILAPVVPSAKKLLLRLCGDQLGWDEVLPITAAQQWVAWHKELHLSSSHLFRDQLGWDEVLPITAAQQWEAWHEELHLSSSHLVMRDRGTSVESFLRSNMWVSAEMELPEQPDLLGQVSPGEVSVRAVQANEQADSNMTFASHIPSWYWLREMIGGLFMFKRTLERTQNRRLLIQPGLDEYKLHENMQTSVCSGSREETNSHLEHSCSVDPFSLGALELSLSLLIFISICRRRGEYG